MSTEPKFRSWTIATVPVVTEPDFSTEAGALEFLSRLQQLSVPPKERPFKEIIALRGHQYYALFSSLVTFVLVVTVFVMLKALGPAGGYDTTWVLPKAATVLMCLVFLSAPYVGFLFGYRWLFSDRLAERTAMKGTAQISPQEKVEVEASTNTLKLCILELKFLIDSLNDKLAVISQALALFIPMLLFFHVITVILSGSDPITDKTPVALIVNGGTLLIGAIALTVFIPLRSLAYLRIKKFRNWMKQAESILLAR
jgi:hypothetical protein